MQPTAQAVGLKCNKEKITRPKGFLMARHFIAAIKGICIRARLQTCRVKQDHTERPQAAWVTIAKIGADNFSIWPIAQIERNGREQEADDPAASDYGRNAPHVELAHLDEPASCDSDDRTQEDCAGAEEH